MKQKWLSILILCISCYFIMSAYCLTLTSYIDHEIQVPPLDVNITSENLFPTGQIQTTIPTFSLYAKGACLMDATNNRVLFEKEANVLMPMASTTKIMTCIVALENGSLEDIVTISKYASSMPDVQLNSKKDEQYYLKDLLYSLMLESHNDTAVAIAEHIGGSVEGFATMMNAKAKELGCLHTNFVTPNGLDATNHQTTATDLAKIAAYAIHNEAFIGITNTASWSFHEIKTNRSFTVNNKDQFLNLYDGAIGVKTGFTSKAGYCFVGAVNKDNKKFISVVLAAGWPPHKSYKWSDTKNLMNFGMQNYETTTIFDTEKPLNPLPVEGGKTQNVRISLKGSISLLLSKFDKATVHYMLPRQLTAPVNPGDLIGTAQYYVNDNLYQELPITTSGSVDRIDFPFCFKKIFSFFSFCCI